MNKFTKIGLSALCGSLANIAAVNAGTLDVSGSATATWTKLSGQVTGNPIGMATGITFTGNGELDGGQTFDVTITHTNKDVYSTAGITLNTNNLGTFKLNSGGGGAGIGGYDDNQPTAWEEVWGTGITTNANLQKGVANTTNISWTTPKVGGTKLQVAYSPDNDGSTSVNKGVSGSANDEFGAGWDVVLDTGTENGEINMFIGASRTELAKQKPGKDFSDDHEEAVVGLKFKMGPVALGGQVSAERVPTETINTTNYYANSSWGLAFNINDSLSLSYSQTRHVQGKEKKQSWTKSLQKAKGRIDTEYNPKSWMRGESIQAAWTIGGVSIKYADTRYDNTAYTFDAKVPRESTIIAVSLAF